MVDAKMKALAVLRKDIESGAVDVPRELLKAVAERLMSAEADAACGASYGERSEDRVNRRNGNRQRQWDTRVGTVDLGVPRLRSGSYFPQWLLEPRRRAERALTQVVAESYVLGVSTRRVDKLVQSMGIDGISKSEVSRLAEDLDELVEQFRSRPLDAGPYTYLWLDAHTQRCREGGRIVNVATVVAIGVNADGHREVLGVDVITTDDGTGWTAFLRSLKARGLSGVRLVVSDAHEGLKDAIGAVLPGASWQRRRTHFMRNLLTRVPKSSQQIVATLVRSIFSQTASDATWEQERRVVEQFETTFPNGGRTYGTGAQTPRYLGRRRPALPSRAALHHGLTHGHPGDGSPRGQCPHTSVVRAAWRGQCPVKWCSKTTHAARSTRTTLAGRRGAGTSPNRSFVPPSPCTRRA